MIYDLNVIDVNDQRIECVLDGTPFDITLSWNETARSFFIGLINSDGETILSGIKVVPNYGLLYQYRMPFMPLGELMVTLTDAIPRIERDSFARKFATLRYIPEAHLEELGVLDLYGKI